jgi:hypothetical protein
MRLRVSQSTLEWVALALAGLIVAVSVSYAASQLSKPKVGLSSEPVSAVSDLAPSRPAPRRPAVTAPPPATATATTPAPIPTEDDGEVDDDD